MTEKHKQVFRKINSDADVRTLQPGEYRFLRNGINVQGTTVDAHGNAITSLYGNALVTNSDLEASSTIVGFVEDRVNDRAFFAVYHASNPTIYKVTLAGVVSIVMRTSILGFAATDFVDMDIIGDILILTNNTGEVKKINVTTAAAGDYGTVTDEKISLIKRGPQLPIMVDRNADGAVTNNYIDEFFFLMTYRYIYEDGEESVFAPPSLVMYEATVGSNKNRIAYEIPSAESIPTTVTQIDFAISSNGSNELSVFKSVAVSGGSKPALAYVYNAGGITIPDSASIKWSESIPLKSKSLKIFKNRVFLFENTEGYDASQKVLSGFTAVSDSGLSDPAFINDGAYLVGLMYLDAKGRIISVRMSSSGIVPIPDRSESTLTRYSILWSVASVAMADIPSEATHYCILRTKCLNKSFFLTGRTSDMYYIQKDADGVITYNKTYSANNDGVAIDISHLTEYQIGYTFQPGDRIKIYNGSTVHNKLIRSQDGRFLFLDNFENTSIGAGNASHDIFEIFTPRVPQATETLYEALEWRSPTPTYNGASLTPELGSYAAKFVISNPGTGSRALSVTTGRLTGDAVYVSSGAYTDLGRTTDFSYSGYSDTDPYSNTRVTSTLADILVMNPISKFYNVWQHGVGMRSTVTPLTDATQITKTTLRFSQLYIQNTNVNGLNIFEALDEYQLPADNGPGTILTEAGDVLVGLHQIESTAIYIGEGYVNTTSGNNFLAKTDNVVGDDRRYLGGHGTTHPKSVVSRDSRVYFYDSKKGCIVRRSQDGLTVISDYGIKGLVSYLAKIHNADSGNSRIVAGWDPQYDCYCISFYLTGGSYNFTLYFHEKTNSWVCASDLMPYLFGTIGQYQLAFTSTAALYKQTPEDNYNLFFGVQYNRSLEWEISPLDSLMKILEGIEVDQTSIYSTAGSNEEIVSVYLVKGGTKQTMINYVDFRQREGVWRSAFFKMITDVNFATAVESKYKSPYAVRGQSFYMTLAYNGTDKNVLKSITTFFRPKMLSST